MTYQLGVTFQTSVPFADLIVWYISRRCYLPVRLWHEAADNRTLRQCKTHPCLIRCSNKSRAYIRVLCTVIGMHVMRYLIGRDSPPRFHAAFDHLITPTYIQAEFSFLHIGAARQLLLRTISQHQWFSQGLNCQKLLWALLDDRGVRIRNKAGFILCNIPRCIKAETGNPEEGSSTPPRTPSKGLIKMMESSQLQLQISTSKRKYLNHRLCPSKCRPLLPKLQ